MQKVLVALPKDVQPEHKVDPKAYEAYLNGRFLWNQRTTQSLTEAISSFQKAIEYDATYAPSYAGLADCYALLGSAPYTDLPPNEAFPKAKANARKRLNWMADSRKPTYRWHIPRSCTIGTTQKLKKNSRGP